GPGTAAQEAVGAVVAGLLGLTADGVLAGRSGVDGDGYQAGGVARAIGGPEEGPRAGRKGLARGRYQRGRRHDLLDALVVRGHGGRGDRRRPLRTFEDDVRRPQLDVEIDQRAAAHTDALEHVHAREHPVLEEAEA